MTNTTHAFFIEKGLVDWWSIEAGAIYSCRFDLSSYERELFELFAVPFTDTVERAVPKRQAEYLAGRYCAQQALQTIDCPSSLIGTGQHRQPLWPPGVIGSISHRSNTAVACVSRNPNLAGLGIDLETRITPETMQRVEAQILTAAEKQVLAQTNLEQEVCFTLAFSLKESFFKAAYPQVGHYFDFEAISLVHLNQTDELIQFRLNTDLSGNLRKGQHLTGFYKILCEDMVVTFVQLTQESYGKP